MKRRIFSFLMALALVVSLLPMEVFAEETQPVTEPAVLADEPVVEPTVPATSAPTVPETSAPTVPETSDPTVPSTEPSTESEPVTESVTEPVTVPETQNVTEPSTEASEPETILVTAWTWVDPEEYLEDGGLALPGASAGNPASFETVVSMLPAAIMAVTAEGEISMPLTWACPGYPAGGAYEGEYSFTATLPEGYALAEGAAALTVKVTLGGGATFDLEVILHPDAVTLMAGDTYDLYFDIFPSDAICNNLTCTSSDDFVATAVVEREEENLSGRIKLTAVAAGRVVITVNADNMTATCAVTVVERPTDVASVNGTNYPSLSEAVNAAAPGDTVTLLNDWVQNEDIYIDENLTLDLNEHILIVQRSYGIQVKSGSTLTVKTGTNGDIKSGYHNYTIQCFGALKVEGHGISSRFVVNGGAILGGTFHDVVVLQNYAAIADGFFNSDVNVFSGSVVTGGSFKNSPSGIASGYHASLAGDYYVIVPSDAIAMVGGKGYATLAAAANAAQPGETITLLADATINSQDEVQLKNNLDLNGHNITLNYSYGINIPVGADVTISGISGNANIEGKPLGIKVYGDLTTSGDALITGVSVQPDAIISGGHYKGNVMLSGEIRKGTFDGHVTGLNGQGTISGGIFSGGFVTSIEKITGGSFKNSVIGAIISGGSFKTDPRRETKNTIPDGYAVLGVGGETPYQVVPTTDTAYTNSQAQIGDTRFVTLQAAVDTCPVGGTIVLLDNLSVDGVFIDKTLTLDINGKTLTMSDDPGIGVRNGATLTIDQNTHGGVVTSDMIGEIEVQANSILCVEGICGARVTVRQSASIVKGEFTERVYSEGTLSGGVYNADVTVSGSITGGEFDGQVLLKNGTISGGTFHTGLADESTGRITGGNFDGLIDPGLLAANHLALDIPTNHYRVTPVSYSATDNVLTITSTDPAYPWSATATITATDAVYNGREQRTAEVTFSDSWPSILKNLTADYEGDTKNVGTATASITVGGVKAQTTYQITQSAATISVTKDNTGDYTYGDTITLTATATATGTSPTTRARTAPTANQMAVFKADGTQISDPADVVSGKCELTVNTTDLGAGDHTLTVKFMGNTNLAEAQGAVQVIVNKATLTPAVSGMITKTYDGSTTAFGSITLTGAVNSEQPTATATFTYDNANVGTDKTVTSSNITLDGSWGDNYVLSTNTLTATGTITQATPTSLTTPTVEQVIYETTLAEIALPTGWAWADDTITPTVTNSGYTAYYAVSDYINYDWSNVEGYNGTARRVERTVQVTVTKAEPAYTVPTSLTATYGDTLNDVELTDGWTWDAPANSVGSVGDNSFQATFTPGDTDNYNTVTQNLTVTVSKATLTITADELSKVYGENDPALTYTVSGLVGTDTTEGSLTRAEGENVGTYAITRGTLTASDNYDLQFTGAVFTINPANINTATITLGTVPLTYNGQAQEPPVTVKMGDTPLVKDADYILTYGNNVNAGTAKVTVTGIGNYTQVKELTFAIEKAPLTIQANDQTITYGEKIATGLDRVTVTRLMNGETLEKITLTPSGTDATADGTITPSDAQLSGSLGNYNVTYTDGKLTINKATPTYTAPTANTLTYNKNAQNLVTAGSTQHGTILYKLDGEYSEAIPTATTAGTYTVTWKLTGDQNHTDVAEQSITVTIKPKEVTDLNIEIIGGPFYYTGSEIKPTVTVKDEQAEIPNDEYTVSYSDNTNVGKNAKVTVQDMAGHNYTFDPVTVTFTIEQADTDYEGENGGKVVTVNEDGKPETDFVYGENIFIKVTPKAIAPSPIAAFFARIAPGSNEMVIRYKGEELTAPQPVPPGETLAFEVPAVKPLQASPNPVELEIYFSGSANMRAYSETVKVNITKAKAEDVTAPKQEGGATYGMKLSEIQLTDENWKWVDGEKLPTAGTTEQDAYILVDDTNYDWNDIHGYEEAHHRVVRPIEVKVATADPAYQKPEGLTSVTGKTLADVKLPEGWKWEVPTRAITEVGAMAANAIFTPADTDNFHSVTVELTVNVQCQVTFDSKDGSSVPGQIVGVDGKLTEPAEPTREGYAFRGWFKDSACTEAWNFKTDNIRDDSTLYAKWAEIFTLTFDANTKSTVTNMPDPKEKAEDEKSLNVTIPYGKPRRSGYSFSAWNTKADGSGDSYKPGASFELKQDTTFYAQWKKVDPTNARTGDYIMIAVAVLAVSGIALAGLIVYSKKKKK